MKITFLLSIIVATTIAKEKITYINLNNQLKQDSSWHKLHLPLASSIRKFAESNNHIFYVATTSGVFKSVNYGKKWQSAGLGGQVIDEILITAKGTLLAGSYRSGMFRSDNKGKNWKKLGFDKNAYIYSIIQGNNNSLLASAAFVSEGASDKTLTGVFKSFDDGRTWHQTALKDKDIFYLGMPRQGLLFASSTKKKYRSIDNGISWINSGRGLPDSIPLSGLVSLENSLFASVGNRQDESGKVRGGIFRSDDAGLTWVRSDNGINIGAPVSSIYRYKNILFATAGFESKSMFSGIYKSLDKGKTWTKVGLPDKIVRFITVTSKGALIAATNGYALFVSSNSGKNWQQIGSGIDNWETFRVLRSGKNLFVSGCGIWRSSDDGNNWKKIREDGGIDITVTSNGRLIVFENNQILASDNRGATWYKVKDIKGDMGLFKKLNDSLVIACIANNGSYYTINGGLTWKKYQIPGYENASMRTSILTPAGFLLMSGSNKESSFVFRSINKGQAWEKVKEFNDKEVWGFTVNGKIIFAGTYANGILKSIDDGITWAYCNNGLRKDNEYVTVTSLTTGRNNEIFCSTLGKGVFVSKNQGERWNAYNKGLSDKHIWTIYYDIKSKSIYAASPSGIFKTLPDAPQE